MTTPCSSTTRASKRNTLKKSKNGPPKAGTFVTALIAKAQQALDRVPAAPSELLDLWSESEDLAAWKTSIADIKRRLAG